MTIPSHPGGQPLVANAPSPPGLLKAASHSGGRSGFSALRKALQLLVPEPEQLDPGQGPPPPSDVSHLYKGYAPISIRLVETALRCVLYSSSPPHQI